MEKNEKLPPRTVERLSKYRRLLFKYKEMEEAHFFSHTTIAGVPCYPSDKMEEIIREKTIHIAILTVPPESAARTAILLQQAGIKGILNFTSVHLDVTPEIYLKNYDIITSLEEIGFFI